MKPRCNFKRVTQSRSRQSVQLQFFFVSVVLSGLLALAAFVVRDFFYCHIRCNDGTSRWTASEIVKAPYWDEEQSFFLKKDLPKVRLLIYEGVFLLWIRQRADSLFHAIFIGSSIGMAIALAASIRCRTTINGA